MGLAEKLYCTMMSIGYYARLNGGPEALAKIITDIALSSLEKWRSDKKAMIQFTKDFLATNQSNERRGTLTLIQQVPFGGFFTYSNI